MPDIPQLVQEYGSRGAEKDKYIFNLHDEVQRKPDLFRILRGLVDQLSPFSITEVQASDPLGFNVEKLWFRGGFPDSYPAPSEAESWNWRSDFIATYVERDIPLMGPQIPAAKLRRFWTMLAHYHGQQVVFSELGRSVEVIGSAEFISITNG